MKFIIIALTVLGLAYGKSIPTQSLEDDFNDFLALVPTDKVLEIVMDYVQNDKEFQDVIKYLQSDDFKNIVLAIDNLEEYIKFLNYLQKQNLDVYYYVNKVHELLDLPPLPVPPKPISTRRGTGLNGCINDVIAILPVEKLKALFYEKLETSPDFKALYDAIRAPEFQNIIKTLQSLPEYQELIQKLRDRGVDVDKIIEILRALFGLSRGKSIPTQSLEDDFNDFLALVPTDKVLEIVMDYVQNDREFQDVIKYLQSDDFKNIVLAIDNLEEYIKFLNYLQKQNLDVYYYVNKVHELLDLPPLPVPPKPRSTRRGTGLNGCINDVIAILPVEKLKALFYEKLETSPDFKALYDAIRAPEFQNIIKTLQSLPEYQELIQKLRDRGVDVDKIIEILRALFGLSRGYHA